MRDSLSIPDTGGMGSVTDAAQGTADSVKPHAQVPILCRVSLKGTMIKSGEQKIGSTVQLRTKNGKLVEKLRFLRIEPPHPVLLL